MTPSNASMPQGTEWDAREDGGAAQPHTLHWRVSPQEAASFVDRQAAREEAKRAWREQFRDTAAIAALQGIGTWVPGHQFGMTDDEGIKARAEWAYRQADAMLAARRPSKAEGGE